MSCAESDAVCAVSTNKKRGLEREEDDNGCTKIPCIDFQPDERWHVKDDSPNLRCDVKKRDKNQTQESGENEKPENDMSDNEDSLSSDSDSCSNSPSLPEGEQVEEPNESSTPAETSKLNGELLSKDAKEGTGSREPEEEDASVRERPASPVSKHSSNSEKGSGNDEEDSNEPLPAKPSVPDDEDANHASCESSNESSDNPAADDQHVTETRNQNLDKLPADVTVSEPVHKNADGADVKKQDAVSAKEKPANLDLDSFSADTSCSANSDHSSLNMKKEKPVSECSESSTDSFSESDDAKKSVPSEPMTIVKEPVERADSSIDKVSSVVSRQKKGKATAASRDDGKLPLSEEEYEKIAEKIRDEAKFPKAFEGVVKIGLYIPMKVPKTGEFKLADNEAVLESPSHVAPLLLKRNNQFPPREEKTKSKLSKSNSGGSDYFNNSVGQFLMGLGLSRAKEWYERDLVRLREKQLRKEGRIKALDEEYKNHLSAYHQARQANDPFTFQLKRCEICDFRTESQATIEGHYLVPHMTPRREYRCSFCQFTTRDPQGIIFHMEAIHNKTGVIEPLPLFYECPVCFYETHLKTKATSHINKCQRYFNSIQNQAPPEDFEYPSITAKPITVEDIKRYDMYLSALTKSRSASGAMVNAQGTHGRYARKLDSLTARSLMTSNVPLYQQLASSTMGDKSGSHIGIRPRCPTASPCGIQLPPGLVITRAKTPDISSQVRSARGQLSVPTPTNQIYQVVSSTGEVLPVLNNNSVLNSVSQQFSLVPSSIGTCLVSRSERGPQPVALVPNVANGGISITRLPTSTSLTISRTTHSGGVQGATSLSHTRLQAPNTVQSARPGGPGTPNTLLNNSTFVICEICDGYIKDLDQLRTHMQLIHKVKIHPKMLASRPPLNCQKCQWRFFTDQGLERHLLGAHGLVTSNMQEMANTNQDGGRCTVCGRVFVCKLVAHMSQVHKVTLKPAHLSYKCTVCSATFNLYKLFESHVYMVHSGAVKRSSEETNGHQRKKLASEPSSGDAKQSSKAKSGATKKYETIVPTKDDDDMSTKDEEEDNASTKDDEEEMESTKDDDNASAKDEDDSSKEGEDVESTKEGGEDDTSTKDDVSAKDEAPPAKDEVPPNNKEDTSVKDNPEEKDKVGDMSPKKEDKPADAPASPETEDADDEVEEVFCPSCGLCCDSVHDHIKQKHLKDVSVKLCRIEQCEKCLCSFDGMVVLHTSDFDMGDEEDEEEDEEGEEPSESNDVEPSDSNIEPSDSKNGEPSDSKSVEPSDSKNELTDSKSIELSDSKDVEPSESKDVEPPDSKSVEPSDSKSVEPSDSKSVEPSDSKGVEPSDSKSVEPSDSKNVEPSDSKNAEPSDSKNAEPSDSKNAELSDSKSEPCDSKIVKPTDSNNVEPPDSSNVEPSDSSNVESSDSNTVGPADSNDIEPAGSNNVEPSDSNDVEPSDSITVEPADLNKVESSDSSSVEPPDLADDELSESKKVEPSGSNDIEPSEDPKEDLKEPTSENVSETNG